MILVIVLIYLDYSATTFPDKKVLKEFKNVAKKYRGNPNSSHKLGRLASEKIELCSNQILKLLEANFFEVIYTSGSSEANNLAIKGICSANKGKHIITTKLEHSSVIAPISRLCQNGYEVSFVNLNPAGTVDLKHLKSLMRKDTVLVSIVAVDSELGIKQNLNGISKILKEFPNCYFHVDATQAIGKTKLDFSKADLVSFSAHKFFGIKGIGCLLKKKNVKILPQIDGGKSTTKYRSGTPALELIVSLKKALELALNNQEKKLLYVKSISKDLKAFLETFEGITINNTYKSIDQIINFSILNSKKLVALLDEQNVFLSTKSACSSSDESSKVIMELYKDDKRASNSIRISLSYTTTKKEIKKFKEIFRECYEKLGD